MNTHNLILQTARDGGDFAPIEAHIAETYKASPGVTNAAKVLFETAKKGGEKPTDMTFLKDAANSLVKEPLEAAKAAKAAGAKVGFVTRLLSERPLAAAGTGAILGAAALLETRHLLSGKNHAQTVTAKRETAAESSQSAGLA